MQIVIRAQSAMEYLMTYGWAILIIAVVLGALFELGVFSGTFFMPHVPPGSCHVFRPYGPGTLDAINLEGECVGALPEYTAEFSSNTKILLNFSRYQSLGNYSITLWVKLSNSITVNNADYLFSVVNLTNGPAYWLAIGGYDFPYAQYADPNGDVYTRGSLNDIPLDSWEFLSLTWNSSNKALTLYLNGNNIGTNNTLYTAPLKSTAHSAYIGSAFGSAFIGNYYLYGDLADVQLYNKSISQNSINAIYSEGIGGAPVDLQNLVGWWPLNGNTNDYSGNNNDGNAANVIYTTNWESGYTQP